MKKISNFQEEDIGYVSFNPNPYGGHVKTIKLVGKYKKVLETVSYTHLTLPTKA